MKKELKTHYPITDEQQKMTKQLAMCRFLPGSFEKKFARDMAGATTLTTGQAEYLQKLHHRYRKQIANLK